MFTFFSTLGYFRGWVRYSHSWALRDILLQRGLFLKHATGIEQVVTGYFAPKSFRRGYLAPYFRVI